MEPLFKGDLTGRACFRPALQLDPIGTVRSVPGAEQHVQCGRSLDRGSAADPWLSVGRLDLLPRHQKRNLLLFSRTHCYVSLHIFIIGFFFLPLPDIDEY